MNPPAADRPSDATTTVAPPPFDDHSLAAGAVVDETFEALVVDWDGTVVPDRLADAGRARATIEALCAAGAHVFIVTGTNAENVDRQLCARPGGPGRLHLCCNRGSEIFEVSAGGPVLLHRRLATDTENLALDRAAAATVARLADRGLEAAVVADRLNRRKVDIIPVAQWADPKKSETDRLLAAVTARLGGAGIADLAAVVAVAAEASREAGLDDPRITSDVKHVEIGLTDKADSARFAASWLGELGITGRLVLIGGDEFGTVGGVPGSDSLMMVPSLARSGRRLGRRGAVLGAARRGPPRRRTAPAAGPLRRTAGPSSAAPGPRRRRRPGLGRPAAGRRRRRRRVARRALQRLGGDPGDPRGARRLRGPALRGRYLQRRRPAARRAGWTALDLAQVPRLSGDRRLLDLRTGVLARGGALRSLRLVPATAPNALALRAEGDAGVLLGGAPLSAPPGAEGFARHDGDGGIAARVGRPGAGIAVAARDETVDHGDLRVVERLAAWAAAAPGPDGTGEARRRLDLTRSAGFDRLLADHRAEWARRWADAEVVIEGTPEDQLAARFAVFHLLSAVADHGEAAVGARGLTGPGYAGHVFWDADVFVLPVLAALRPAAARAMLEYRIRRLPAARARGRRPRAQAGPASPGSRAATATTSPPARLRGSHGEVLPIATGPHEEHIMADVAWAAWQYADVDRRRRAPRRRGAGAGGRHRPLLGEPGPSGADGAAHIYGGEGPDEYHEVVDDNAYTNVMARWNLRRGAELAERDGRPGTRSRPAGASWPTPSSTGGVPSGASTSSSPATSTSSRCSCPRWARRRWRPTGARRRAGARLTAHQAGRRPHAPPPRARRGGARLARPVPRLLLAAHRPRQLARPRRSTPRCWPAPGAWRRRSTSSAWPRASTSTTSPTPPTAGSTWPPWAARGRRWPGGSWGCRQRGRPSASTPNSPHPGTPSACGCAFWDGRSASGPGTVR